jgi:two-component system, sensor histidine kinase PdtaS
MREVQKKIKYLVFSLLVYLPALESIAQSDSLTIIQEIDKTEELMEIDFPQSKSTIAELNRVSSSSTCQSCKGRALIILAKTHWYDGEYDKAVMYLKQGIKFSQQANDSASWAKAANLIGNCFYYQAYYDSAIYYFQQSLSVYRKINNKEGARWNLRDISLMYHRKGDYRKAVEYILKLEEMNEGLQTETELADFPGMGSFFSDSLYYHEKISDNLKALARQLNEDKQFVASDTYLNLALASNQLKEYLSAARYYVKSYTLKEKLGFRPQWDFAGVNYKEANMKDSSLYYHHKSKLGFKKDTQLNILYTYELLGEAHFHFDQLDSALHNYNIAMKMNVKCNNRITVAGLHRRLADTYIKMGRFSEAEEQIQTGIALANEVSMAHRRNLYKSATQLYSRTGDYKKAFSFQNQYTNLADSLARMETALNLTRLLAQYKTSKKERELELLKTANEKKELVLENKNVTIETLAIVTLTSIIFIAVFAKQRNKIRKKNLALDRANKEQMVLMQEVHHRVKNNLQLIASLINLQSNQVASAEVAIELEKTRSRIMSIALIHQKLYQQENMSSVDLQSFLVSLMENILSTLPPEMKIEKRIDIALVRVEIEAAISIGLMVNELVNNSIKHGLTGINSPQLKVELTNLQGKIILLVEDNGSRRTGNDPTKTEQGFGLHLIEILLRRLSGTIHTDFQNGRQTRIEIPHKENF